MEYSNKEYMAGKKLYEESRDLTYQARYSFLDMSNDEKEFWIKKAKEQ